MPPVNPYALRAERTSDPLKHRICRRAFVQHVVADPRTRSLFAYWGETIGVDAVVAEMVALLDAAAQRAGLAHRSDLRRQENAFHLIPILGFLQQHEERYEQLLTRTGQDRERQAIGFVVAELYGTTIDEQVPIRAWLAKDLLT
jgi:hypothetical protein